MRSTNRVLASLAAVSMAALLSGAAFAQEPPAGAPPPPAGAAQGQRGEHMREHAEHRAKALHDILNIRPDQEGAFQTFIGSMRPQAGHEGMRGGHDRDEVKS